MKHLLNIRQTEVRTVLVLLTFVFFVQTVLSTGKVLQFSVFLDAYGQESLALAFVLSAAVVIAVSAVYAALTRLIQPAVLIPSMLGALALGFVLWRLVFGAPHREFPLLLTNALEGVESPAGPFVLYVWVEVASALAIVQAWAYVNDAFDPRQAKRLIPLIGLGASASFLVNGLGVQPLVTHWVDADELTWIVAGAFGLSILSFFLSMRHGAVGPALAAAPPPRSGAGGRSGLIVGLREGFPQIARSPLLRLLVFVSLVTIVTEGLLDYLFMNALRERLTKNELAAFYASFIAVLGVVQVLLQLLVSGNVLVRFGSPVILMLTPVAVALGGTLFLIFPAFWLLVALRFGDRMCKQAFYSPSLQALYTPVPSGEKRQTMTLIKGVLSPAAYGVFGLLMLLGGARLSARALVAILVAMTLITAVVLILHARQAYGEALRRTMRRGHADLDAATADFAVALDGETIAAVQRVVFEEGDERRAVLGLQLVAGSDLPQVRALILRAARLHGAPVVRREASRLIARGAWPMDAPRILGLLRTETHPSVVQQHLLTVAALRGLEASPEVAARLAAPEPAVRAAAAIAALRLDLDVDRARRVAEALVHGSPAERLALAGTLARGGGPGEAWLCTPLLEDARRTVRSRALRAAAAMGAPELLPGVLRCFLETGPREEAGRTLVALGPAAAPDLARPALDPEADEGLRRHAIRCLGQLDDPVAGAALEQLLAHRAHGLRYAAGSALRTLCRASVAYPGPTRVVVLARLLGEVRVGYLLRSLAAGLRQHGSPLDPPLTLGEIEIRLRACEDHVFGLLSLVDRHRTSGLVLRNARFGSAKQRTHALELLELTFSRYESLVLVDFLQYDLDPINIYRVMPDALDRLDRARRDPVAAILAGRDAGLVRCVAREFPAEAASPAGGDAAALTRALLLRRAAAFRSLSLDELLALGAAATEVHVDAGGPLFRAGQPSEALYVVVRGTVHLRREGRDLAWLGPGDCLGEAAVVDGDPYPCDAEAEPGAALLRIDGAALAEALPGHPRLVRGLLRHLASVLPAEDRPAA